MKEIDLLIDCLQRLKQGETISYLDDEHVRWYIKYDKQEGTFYNNADPTRSNYRRPWRNTDIEQLLDMIKEYYLAEKRKEG